MAVACHADLTAPRAPSSSIPRPGYLAAPPSRAGPPARAAKPRGRGRGTGPHRRGHHPARGAAGRGRHRLRAARVRPSAPARTRCPRSRLTSVARDVEETSGAAFLEKSLASPRGDESICSSREGQSLISPSLQELRSNVSGVYSRATGPCPLTEDPPGHHVGQGVDARTSSGRPASATPDQPESMAMVLSFGLSGLTRMWACLAHSRPWMGGLQTPLLPVLGRSRIGSADTMTQSGWL